jgi:hypothetical protein
MPRDCRHRIWPGHGQPANGGEGWIRTSVRLRGQIYSLLPLTTRPPLHDRHAQTIRGMVEHGDGRRATWRRHFCLSTRSTDGSAGRPSLCSVAPKLDRAPRATRSSARRHFRVCAGIGRVAPPLRSGRSNFDHAPGMAKIGAGEGNRTLVVSLEGFCSTIELHPLGSGRVQCHCVIGAVNRAQSA